MLAAGLSKPLAPINLIKFLDLSGLRSQLLSKNERALLCHAQKEQASSEESSVGVFNPGEHVPFQMFYLTIA